MSHPITSVTEQGRARPEASGAGAAGSDRNGWFVVAMVGLVLILDGYDMQAAAFAAPALQADWGLSKAALGPVMAAAFVGMAIGTGLGGSLGDRFGRRPALLGGVLAFGLLGLSCAFARNVAELTILRVLAGIGFGIVFPNGVTLVAESLPDRWRSFGVSISIVAIPCGGMIGAGLSSWLVPAYGWQACFAVGGLIPLVLLVALWFVIPESRQFASLSEARSKAGARETLFKALFEPPFTRLTAGLWLALFGSTFFLYSYTSWLPVVLSGKDVPQAAAIRGSMYFNMFALAGSLAASWLIGWRGSRKVLLLASALALAGTVVVASQLIGGIHYGTAVIGLAVAGTGIGTIQVALWAVAAHGYSPDRRARGIGWTSSVGRLGAILSAAIGGALLQLAFGDEAFVGALFVTILAAVLGMMVVDRHIPRGNDNHQTD